MTLFLCHQFFFWPNNILGREIDAHKAERAWLVKKNKCPDQKENVSIIESRIQEIDDLLADNAALLKQVYNIK